MRSWIALFLFLFAAACGDGAPSAPEHEDTPRLQARIEALLPHLRAEIEDIAIGEDTAIVVDREEFKRRAGAECSYAEAVFGPSTEEERGAGTLLSLLLAMPVITDEGVLLLMRLPSDDDQLDARLIHGLVQAHLVKDLDFGAFRSGPRTLEDALARNAALEAFTRRIGRRVAERAEVTEAYAYFDRGPEPKSDSELRETGWGHRALAALAGDRYLRDAGNTYADRLVELHGLAEGVERLFERPPTTVPTLLAPDGETVETPRGEVGDALRSALADEMTLDPTRPLFRAELEALLRYAGPGKRRAALDSFVSGSALWGEWPGEEFQNTIEVYLVVGKDEPGAESILSAWVDSIRGLDARWKALTPEFHRLESVRFSDHADGFLFERVVDGRSTLAWSRPQQLFFRQGEVVVEIRIEHPGSIDTDALGIGRRVRAALHAAGIGPAPATEDDAAWEIRWKAAVDRTRDESEDKSERAKLLLPLLADADARIRLRACRRIQDLDYGGGVIPWKTLRPLLSDPDAGVRSAASGCLTTYRMPREVRKGEVAPDAFPLADICDEEGPPMEVQAALIAGLSDPDGEVRLRAADALPALGPRSSEVEAAFRRALTDPVPSVREAALSSLSDLEPPLPDLVDLVAPYLDDEDEYKMVRVSAIRVLSHHANLPKQWRARILALLDDEDAWVRGAAADALGELGVRSEAVITALLRRVEDENLDVRNACRRSLRKFGVRPPKPKKR